MFMKRWLINELRKDSRQRFSKLARQKGVSLNDVFEEYYKMELCHTTIIDWERLGFVRAVFCLNNLVVDKRINNCFKTDKGFLTEMVCSSNEELKEFVAKDDVIEYYPVVSDIKREEFSL